MDDFFSIILCEDITATTPEQTFTDQSLESHASGDVDPPGVLADFERGRMVSPTAWCVIA
ncbi:hypothetical protein CPC08DRAFT_712284 [Agrocybe pediades]|nr:hypothetical protein CPC08DRAFT_712284 [Agrocybe pediades]